MHKWPDRFLRALPIWLAAAWCMSLTTLGFFVVPMLFANLPSPAMAGAVAGQLFSVQTGISVACSIAILLLLRRGAASEDTPSSAHGGASVVLLAGALLALLVEFGVAPHIRAHDNLPLWHGLGSAMYALQWLCSLLTFGRYAKSASAST